MSKHRKAIDYVVLVWFLAVVAGEVWVAWHWTDRPLAANVFRLVAVPVTFWILGRGFGLSRPRVQQFFRNLTNRTRDR